MKKKLLFDGRGITSKPCGVRTVAERYLVEFSKLYDVTVIINKGMENNVPDTVKKIIKSNKFNSRFNPFSDLWISWLVIRNKPHVFFSAHSFLPVFSLLPKQKGFICHDLFSVFDKSFFEKRGLMAIFIRYYFRFLSEFSFLRAKLIIAPSYSIRQTFKGLLFSSNNIIVIPNGIDISIVSSANELVRLKQILYVGNFRSYKGLDVLLHAWMQISKEQVVEGWTLIIVTNESTDAVRDLRSLYPDLISVKIFSRIDNNELYNLRITSSILVVPSRMEGFGIPLLEAIASGGKIICSDIPVFREILTNFNLDNVTVFQSGNIEELVSYMFFNIKKILDSNFKFSEFNSSINQKLLSSNYSWCSAAEKIKNAFDKLD
jgi:glycosyltransferase involved in cell wall biosynthesis